jgi:WD40 repeat protein/glutaredoxin-related protein
MEEVVLFITRNRDGVVGELSRRAQAILEHHGVRASVYDVTEEPDLERDVQRYSGWQYFPQLFVRAEFIGGTMVLDEYFASGEFDRMIGSTLTHGARFRPYHDPNPRDELWRIALGKKTNFVACAGADGTLTFGRLGDRTELFRRRSHNGWVNAVCFDANEKRIITVGTDRALRVLNISTQTETVVQEAHLRWINDIAPIPNSSLVASASADRTIALWDTEQPVLMRRSAPGESLHWCICALHDGHQTASGDADGHVSFFRVDDLGREYRIRAHDNSVVAIAPGWADGVISGSHDGLVKWVGLEGLRQVFVGHRVRIWCVATLPDNHLAAGAADGRILIWHNSRQSPIHEISITDIPLSMAWWPSDNSLLIGTSAGTLQQMKVSLFADSQ